jgi:membrane-bound lytic murein transglycosylase D
MYTKLLKLFTGILVCWLSIVPFTALTETSHFWHFSRYSNDFWVTIAHKFSLSRNNHNQEVKQQVKWFQKHPTYVKELTRNSDPYIYYILQETERRGMPAELALMPMVESNYNPYAFSRQGAVGLWQMMPGTASGFGIKINWWYDGRRDIIASTNAALNYLQYLHDYFHDWLLAIAAYNSGEGTVMNAIRRNQRLHKPTDFWSLKLPKETKLYVPKILALAEIIKSSQHYGLRLEPVLNKGYFTSVPMTTSISLPKLAVLAHVNTSVIRKLNSGFRRDITKPSYTHHILIPTSRLEIFKKNLAMLREKEKEMHKTHKAPYTVKKGDTVSTIAIKKHTTIGKIEKNNSLHNDVIRTGQTLNITKKLPSKKSINKKLSNHITEDKLPGPKLTVHTVRKNESINSIARHYQVKVNQIYYWNKSTRRTPIQPGQKISIWKRPSRHKHKKYKVKSGDRIGDIAHKYHVSMQKIRALNHIHDDNLIRIGQTLLIP